MNKFYVIRWHSKNWLTGIPESGFLTNIHQEKSNISQKMFNSVMVFDSEEMAEFHIKESLKTKFEKLTDTFYEIVKMYDAGL